MAVHAPDGSFIAEHGVPASRASCPAFGGPDLSDLFCTTALADAPAAADTDNGLTYVLRGAGKGQTEHRVILS